MNFLAVGTALLLVLVAGAYGQYISCYGCTDKDDPTCTYDSNPKTQQKGDCVSCYTKIMKDKRTQEINIYRGCSKDRCDPSSQNMPECEKEDGKYKCKLCCDYYLCNNQAASSIFLQAAQNYNGAAKITAFGVVVATVLVNIIL